ncbi:AraC family transcriptional regulator [Microvirga sp. KLBC 81]|nr:AraC family transcriptional regulator [Microvirga sp. KLBC 81]
MKGSPGQEINSAPQNGPIIDQTWRSAKLEELENALNTFVSPQRLISTSRETPAGGMFGYRGQIDLGLFRVHVESDVEINQAPEDANDRMAFVTSLSRPSQLKIQGETFSISQQHAVIFPSGPQRVIVVPKDAEHHVLITSRHKIMECCAKLLGYDIPGFLDFDVGVDLDTSTGHSWLRLLEYVEAELSDPGALIRQSPIAWRQFEQSLLTGFLLSHRHTYTNALLRPQSAVAPFYVKRAEAYIEAHFSEPLSLADIAAHARVSARSLQNGFQSFRGMTPMAFLRSVRLQHVHRALLAADPAAATVTEIALACGFGHMGEFGTLYKRTFGETPKQTLAKAVYR